MKIWQRVAAILVVALGSGLGSMAHGQSVCVLPSAVDKPDSTSAARPVVVINLSRSDLIPEGARDPWRTAELHETCDDRRWSRLYLPTGAGRRWANCRPLGRCIHSMQGGSAVYRLPMP